VLHFACRDRNILGIQSELLGAHTVGVRNLICITGDPPRMGTYPDATAVFDVDAIGLANIVTMLNQGLDIGGNPIGSQTALLLGVGANPGALNLDEQQFSQVYGVLQKLGQEAKQKGLSKETPAPQAAEAAKQIMEQFKTETQNLLTPEQTKIFAEVVTHFQVEPGKFGYNFNF